MSRMSTGSKSYLTTIKPGSLAIFGRPYRSYVVLCGDYFKANTNTDEEEAPRYIVGMSYDDMTPGYNSPQDQINVMTIIYYLATRSFPNCQLRCIQPDGTCAGHFSVGTVPLKSLSLLPVNDKVYPLVLDVLADLNKLGDTPTNTALKPFRKYIELYKHIEHYKYLDF